MLAEEGNELGGNTIVLTVTVIEVEPWLPAASYAFAVNVWGPLADPVFHEKLPDELLLVPTTVPSTLRLMEVTPTLSLPLTFTVTPTLGSNAELFAGALKLAVGEVTSAVEPLFTFTWIELEPLLPAASDAVTVNVCVPLTAVPEFHEFVNGEVVLVATAAPSTVRATDFTPTL